MRVCQKVGVAKCISLLFFSIAFINETTFPDLTFENMQATTGELHVQPQMCNSISFEYIILCMYQGELKTMVT